MIIYFLIIPFISSKNIGRFDIVYKLPIAAVHTVILPNTSSMVITDRVNYENIPAEGKWNKTDSIIWDFVKLTFKPIQVEVDPLCANGIIAPGPNARLISFGGQGIFFLDISFDI